MEDEVLEFESTAVNEDQESDSEPDDGFLAHTASDDEEDGKLSHVLHAGNPADALL